ncbi:MAG: hypothetical protein J1E63_02330 [Muribaculaceae bacterium]|nr:hypothetical protein [Muribaculaceae bacterium]
MDVKELIEENKRRRERAAAGDAYRPEVQRRADDVARFDDDFEFWAERCVQIRHKLTGRLVPFRLNRAQKLLLAELEKQRRSGKPIRVILLKSRQWGGSTLIQIYMAWIQMVHKDNWHSLICAHVKDTAATIRGMYSCLLDDYPKIYLDADRKPPEFKGFERSQNTRVLTERNCRVTIASAESQEAARGNDFSMAHLSEVAFWRSGPAHSPVDMMRAVTSGIPMQPYTLIALESTANGVGNFFHKEWLRAEAGESAFVPVFVPWYLAEFNELAVDDPAALWRSLSADEREIWTNHPVTLEQLNWYHHKRLEAPSIEAMRAEYPSTPTEAFVNTGSNLFRVGDIERLRAGVKPPIATGNIAGAGAAGRYATRDVKFTPGSDRQEDEVAVWEMPREGVAYIAAVDVGGRSASADYSVIAVIARQRADAPAEVVAQWRGHIDHDLLAWKAASIATFYNNALLVIESNTLETETAATTENDGAYILNRLNHVYTNLYRRQAAGATAGGSRVGFHTNRRTKQMIINHLISIVREADYIERDGMALNELATYERKQNGSLGARDGCHDDLLMTRAIALFVDSMLPAPSTLDRLAPLRAGVSSCDRRGRCW